MFIQKNPTNLDMKAVLMIAIGGVEVKYGICVAVMTDAHVIMRGRNIE